MNVPDKHSVRILHISRDRAETEILADEVRRKARG